jgi:hypothetical protein
MMKPPLAQAQRAVHGHSQGRLAHTKQPNTLWVKWEQKNWCSKH